MSEVKLGQASVLRLADPQQESLLLLLCESYRVLQVQGVDVPILRALHRLRQG